MLELRPNCECCNRDLPPQADDALICTFECTFCIDCATTILRGVCPNCGGELVRRPRRSAEKLATYLLRPDAFSSLKAVGKLSNPSSSACVASRAGVRRSTWC